MANAFDFLEGGGDAASANAFDHLDAAPSGNAFDHLDTGPEPESNLDYAKGLAQSAASGATLGFSDEAAAGMGSLFGLGPKLLGTKSYDEILNETRKSHKDFEAKHPVASTAAELGGAMILPGGIVKSLLGKGIPTLARAVGAGLATGAGTGAVAGFGAGEGGLEARLKQAAKSAAAGAASGSLAPVAGTVARKTANAVSPYVQAAAEQALKHRFYGQNALDALMAKYTGGLSLLVTGPKRAYDVAMRGRQISQNSGPRFGQQLGLGAIAPSVGIAGSDVFSVDIP